MQTDIHILLQNPISGLAVQHTRSGRLHTRGYAMSENAANSLMEMVLCEDAKKNINTGFGETDVLISNQNLFRHQFID